MHWKRNKESLGSPEASVYSQTESERDVRPGLTARITGWLRGSPGTGPSTSNSTKTWSNYLNLPGPFKKFSGKEKFQGYEEAKHKLESTATSISGHSRTETLSRWCAALKELAPASSVLSLLPNTPTHTSKDAEWMLISPTGDRSMDTLLHQNQPLKEVETVYLNGTGYGEPMTFRDVFLSSSALEQTVRGYIQHPAESQEEEELLYALLRLCLAADDEVVLQLVNVISRLSCSASHHQEHVLMSRDEMLSKICSALTALKSSAEAEMLDRRACLLKQAVEEKLQAVVTDSHDDKLECLSQSAPGAELLESQLDSTFTAVELCAQLQSLVVQRTALLKAEQASFASAIEQLMQCKEELATAALSIEQKMRDTQKEREKGELFRVRRVEEMGVKLSAATTEVQKLKSRKAFLEAELAEVTSELQKAASKQADIEESRNVFEEGSAFTDHALQHQQEELSASHGRHVSEAAAVTDCQHLLEIASRGYNRKVGLEQDYVHQLQESMCKDYIQAATHHCTWQQAQLVLLLRQLQFCNTELEGLKGKDAKLAEIGMGSMLADVSTNRQQLQSKYLQSELAFVSHLKQVAAIRSSLDIMFSKGHHGTKLGSEGQDCSGCEFVRSESTPSRAAGGLTRDNVAAEEFLSVIAAIDDLGKQFEALDRPAMPPPLAESDSPSDKSSPGMDSMHDLGIGSGMTDAELQQANLDHPAWRAPSATTHQSASVTFSDGPASSSPPSVDGAAMPIAVDLAEQLAAAQVDDEQAGQQRISGSNGDVCGNDLVSQGDVDCGSMASELEHDPDSRTLTAEQPVGAEQDQRSAEL